MLDPFWKGVITKIEKAINEQSRTRTDENKRIDKRHDEVISRINALTNEIERHNSAQEGAEPGKRTRENWTIGALIAAAIFTFALAGLSTFQLHEMIRVYGPIKSQAESTYALTGAAVDQAKAARDSAEGIKGQLTVMQGQLSEMQRQSSLTINQLRPKLAFSFTGPETLMKIEGKEGWLITPTWQNRGGSEGIDFWGWDNGQLFTPDAPKDFDFVTFNGNISGISKVTIGINEPRLQLSRFISKEDVQSIIDKKAKFVLWGYVEYRESLSGNQPHHIHWCFEVAPVDAGQSYIFSHPAYRAARAHTARRPPRRPSHPESARTSRRAALACRTHR
jgi:hypothetical protein